MLALTVPLVLVAVSLTDPDKPTLSFEGARIQVAQDGSVQLLFDVCVSNVEQTDGVQFSLNYNDEYLVPSDYDTNEALVDPDDQLGPEWVPSGRAFKAASGLYYADTDNDGVYEDVSPFGAALNETDNAAYAFPTRISMYLFIDRTLEVDSAHNSLMTSVAAGERDQATGTAGDPTNINVLQVGQGKKLVLGTLSFRVKDPDLMPIITEKFNGLGIDAGGNTLGVLYEENRAKDGSGDQLIYFTRRATGWGTTPWGIGYVAKGTSNDVYHDIWNDYLNDRDAQAAFSYRFPKSIIKARAAEAELTINAYQAYTDGTVSDIDQALQRYSPAITVTYSDGSEGNFIMPWGRTGTAADALPWTATVAYDWGTEDWTAADWKDSLPSKSVVVDGTAYTGEITYDPTASRYKPEGQRYLVRKSFCYTEVDWYGTLQSKTFPIPIDVKLTVTPITLVDVTASDLTRSYILNDALVAESSLTAIRSAADLKLPTQARLVTDVPAGGVTLTMDIPGWSHPQTYQESGTSVVRYWPSEQLDATSGAVIGTGTAMSDLWKDGATDETDNTVATTREFLHWPAPEDRGKFDTVAPATEPEREANGAYLGANRAGNYTFTMAATYGGTPTHFTRAGIQAVYPWLTIPNSTKVENDPEAWPIDDAKRTIVWNADPAKETIPPSDEQDPNPTLADVNNYRVEYVQTEDGANGQPQFTLLVTKRDGPTAESGIVSLPDKSEFRLRMPDGTELGIGPVGIGSVDEVALDDWFINNTQGSYVKEAVTNLGDFPGAASGDRWGFHLTANPGDPTTGTYQSKRETLRRYINLGGWFYVSVKEKGDVVILNSQGGETRRDPAKETLWSDFIPVYIPPRDNYYTETKEYNFIGDNAGLYPWSGGVSTTVILPPGTYDQVDASGNPVYTDSTNTVRVVERYDLTTTYNGATGAQPGRLSTFTVDPVPSPDPNNDWQKADSTVTVRGTTRTITTYGREYFLDSALYNAYGKVLNRLLDRGMDVESYDSANAHTATIRVEKDQLAAPEQRERLVLEYVSTNGGEPSYNTDGTNVTNIIFEPRTQGYTLRQDYTLVLRNVGDVDIDGISIDTLTDLTGNSVYDKSKDHAPAGGHFIILKPPASFLPAGESTTFIVTYVYNLEAEGSTPVDYRDKLFITSNSHHTVPQKSVIDSDYDYLLDFDAQFQVTASDIHRVTVRVIPTDENGDPIMGTAGVIVGETDDGHGNKTMNIAAGPTAFAQGNKVYIVVTPYDEYTRHSIVAVDSTGKNLTITEYVGVKVPEGHQVYVFDMPDYDTTVTVTFEEPISSKLRLSDLRIYADRDHDTNQVPENLYPHNADWNVGDRDTNPMHKDHFERRVWKKEFTAQEMSTASTYTKDDGEDLYLMTKGSAASPDFDSQVKQYLVVLPADADWAQVEVDLRSVKYIFDDPDDPIKNLPLTGVTVMMTLYNTDDVNRMLDENDTVIKTDIYPTSYNYNIGGVSGLYSPYAQPGETNGPTPHTSIPFLSPEPGASKYVRIELNYPDDTPGESNNTIRRFYYLELFRAPGEVDAELNYGNSPYGMIMNDSAIANKNSAKTAFVTNGYTFGGMNATQIPSVVTDGMKDLRYWIEAWAPPTETWTAPNANWTTVGDVYDDETGMSKALYDRLSGWYTDSSTGRDVVVTTSNSYNLDLNDYAFFAIMGQTFQDPGLAWAKDSSGRLVDLSEAVLSLTAYTLDNAADKSAAGGQLQRFALPYDTGTTDPAQQADLATRTVTFGFLNNTDGSAAVSGDTVQANWAQWYRDLNGELTQEEAGNTLLELRPGRYKLSYTFPDYDNILADPANGITAEPSYLTVTRDFVVLAPVGDVNADLLTTGADAVVDETLIENRISPDAGKPALGYMADNYDYAAIFKLRTCDVNNDRNINNIDANTILRSTVVEQFYLPTGYKPAGSVTPPTSTPTPTTAP